jgi:hypothetical protein
MLMLNQNKGQSILGEYILLFVIIMGMTTAMTVYFKRSIQGRIHDARGYMFSQIRQRTRPQNAYEGVLYFHREYEPYYKNS